MNSRRLTNIDNYLYEIVEDYIDAISDEEKNEILNSFCSSIWKCENKRRTYDKIIRFSIRKDLLGTDVGQVFETWSEVEYKGYKTMSKEFDWCNLIRQKANNLYTIYFDKDVILAKEYMDALKTPKRLYFNWINGEEMDASELTTIIDDAIANSIKLKGKYQKQKMVLSWEEYKIVVNEFFEKIFNNAVKISDYENKTKIINMYEFINEDNFYIRYFCKSLDGLIKDYQKKYYGLPQSSRKQYIRCQSCGKMIQRRSKKDFSTKYCSRCAIEEKKGKDRLRMANKRKVEKLNS